MNYETLLDKIDVFRNKMEIGKLVVFVGSGVSCNVNNMPSWSALVQKMAEAINYSKCSHCKQKSKKCADACNFKNEYSTEEFLKIPQYVYNKNKNLYKSILKDNIEHPKTDAPISSAIFDLNPKHIITTNYDQLLETSSNILASQYKVIVTDKDLFNSEKSKYIVKMHGDISQLDTIVLKEDDYLSFSQKHILIELFVKSLLVDHTVLFLGYSLNDYNVKLIVNWINYMRIQNKALDINDKIGYLILDEKHIYSREIKYFSNNQIDVVNINKMKIFQDTPGNIKDDRGKRLYSFLRLIADPSLDDDTENTLHAIKVLLQYKFVEYNNILSIINVKRYQKYFDELRLYNADFDNIEKIFALNNKEVNHLKVLLINAGICSIVKFDVGKPKKIYISESPEYMLQKDYLFKLYLNNEYGKLNEELENKLKLTPEKVFYASLLGNILTVDDSIEKEFNNAEELSILYNKAYIDGLHRFSFSTNKIEFFIQNIFSAKEQAIFKFYSNIFEGNNNKKNLMKSKLEKVDNSTGQISLIFDEIQNHAYTQYFLYFYNNLCFKGYSDLQEILKIYIEALLSRNKKRIDIEPFQTSIKSDVYYLNKLDIDITTKFISSKEMLRLIEKYHIDKIYLNSSEIKFLHNCFVNLINSVVDSSIYGFRKDVFETLNVLAVLLTKIDLEKEESELISQAILKFFSCEHITKYFCSIDNYYYNESLRIFNDLIEKVEVHLPINVITTLICNKDFQNYLINVNFSVLAKFVNICIPINFGKNDENFIKEIIEDILDFNYKIMLIRLFYKHFKSNEIVKEYKNYINSNLYKLQPQAIYDFYFSGWMEISEIQTEKFLATVIKTYESKIDGVYIYPDPLESKLECVYILYINDIISDITKLEALKEGRPHLQFLLDPENFDYGLVDFSNYMWMNFAKRKKFMKCFIENKEILIKNIKNKVSDGTVSEQEKKILYGYLLGEDDIFKI